MTAKTHVENEIVDEIMKRRS